MPLYYLHIRSRSQFIEDEEGAEFNEDSGAMAEAVRSARCLIKTPDRILERPPPGGLSVYDVRYWHKAVIPSCTAHVCF